VTFRYYFSKVESFNACWELDLAERSPEWPNDLVFVSSKESGFVKSWLLSKVSGFIKIIRLHLVNQIAIGPRPMNGSNENNEDFAQLAKSKRFTMRTFKFKGAKTPLKKVTSKINKRA
jgi:hypothetical protein